MYKSEHLRFSVCFSVTKKQRDLPGFLAGQRGDISPGGMPKTSASTRAAAPHHLAHLPWGGASHDVQNYLFVDFVGYILFMNV